MKPISVHCKKNTDEYSFYRDSTIQRFEFTLEIAVSLTKVMYQRVLCDSDNQFKRYTKYAGDGL